jgi:hypothetical protein
MYGREVWRQVVDLIKRVPVLAAAIANDIGTPVDEEKLATALSHDVIASLGAALSKRLSGRRPGQGRTARTSR